MIPKMTRLTHFRHDQRRDDRILGANVVVGQEDPVEFLEIRARNQIFFFETLDDLLNAAVEQKKGLQHDFVIRRKCVFSEEEHSLRKTLFFDRLASGSLLLEQLFEGVLLVDGQFERSHVHQQQVHVGQSHQVEKILIVDNVHELGETRSRVQRESRGAPQEQAHHIEGNLFIVVGELQVSEADIGRRHPHGLGHGVILEFGFDNRGE